MKKFRVTEIVRRSYVYTVEADSVEQAVLNVRNGVFNNNKEATAHNTRELDASYSAEEIKA